MTEIQGLENILQRIDNIADTGNLKTVMGNCCALVEGTVKTTAPKGTTGDLRNFTKSRVENDGFNIIGVIYNELEYAPYIEYGTGIHAEKEKGPPGWWVYVDDGTKSGSYPANRYTEKEAKRICASLRAQGLRAYATEGREPKPFLRHALGANREQITKMLGEIIND